MKQPFPFHHTLWLRRDKEKKGLTKRERKSHQAVIGKGLKWWWMDTLLTGYPSLGKVRVIHNAFLSRKRGEQKQRGEKIDPTTVTFKFFTSQQWLGNIQWVVNMEKGEEIFPYLYLYSMICKFVNMKNDNKIYTLHIFFSLFSLQIFIHPLFYGFS